MSPHYLVKCTTFSSDWRYVFATDHLLCPVHFTEIQPLSQQDASATRPYRGLVVDTREKVKKMENWCILQGSAAVCRWGGQMYNLLMSNFLKI